MLWQSLHLVSDAVCPRTEMFELKTAKRRGNSPHVNMVMPTNAATLPTCHSRVIWPTPGLYDPAVKAVKAVMTLATQMMTVFLLSGHSNGDMYAFTSGRAGEGSWPTRVGVTDVGCGKGVASVR